MDARPSPHVLLGCSPRVGGNSDAAMDAWTEGFPDAWALQLRSGRVSPCIACGACARAAHRGNMRLPSLGRNGELSSCARPCGEMPHNQASTGHMASSPAMFGCPLTAGDDSSRFLGAIYRASSLCIISPVYFYFFPAQAKALLDRMQPFWEIRDAGGLPSSPSSSSLDPSPLPSPDRQQRICYTVLLAGRPRGERLFEGSLLSLKYALAPMGYSLAEPLLLRGYDKPADLAADKEALARITLYAREAKKRVDR